MIRSSMSPAQVAAIARKDVGQVLRHAKAKHAALVELCPGPSSKEVLVRSGEFTSSKRLQWIYVITATQGSVSIYIPWSGPRPPWGCVPCSWMTKDRPVSIKSM
ncbi:MAG: hypothetical protein IPH60_08420 [Flavobacteriales bacterium]|nr:hypothetical protein [Flavobacteriales bacterium]